MEVGNDLACDDSFNDFVHNRSGAKKYSSELRRCEGSAVPSTCLEVPDGCESRSSRSGYASDDNTIPDLLRSDGSGSENGLEPTKDTNLTWHGRDTTTNKCNNSIASLHCYVSEKTNKQQVKPGITGDLNGSNWTKKKMHIKDWRDQHMESFESNKEYVGSECGSSLSGCSPNKLPHSQEDLADDEEWDAPKGERWPPLGAPNDDDCISICSFEELGRSVHLYMVVDKV